MKTWGLGPPPWYHPANPPPDVVPTIPGLSRGIWAREKRERKAPRSFRPLFPFNLHRRAVFPRSRPCQASGSVWRSPSRKAPFPGCRRHRASKAPPRNPWVPHAFSSPLPETRAVPLGTTWVGPNPVPQGPKSPAAKLRVNRGTPPSGLRFPPIQGPRVPERPSNPASWENPARKDGNTSPFPAPLASARSR